MLVAAIRSPRADRAPIGRVCAHWRTLPKPWRRASGLSGGQGARSVRHQPLTAPSDIPDISEFLVKR